MTKNLKVAIVAACPFPLARGTPVRILRMAEALAQRDHVVHVATYHLGEGKISPGVTVHRIEDVPSYRKLSPGPTYRKLFVVDPKLARLLRGLLREHRFDVIHAHHYEGVLVGAAARMGMRTPLVYDAHTMMASELPFYPLGLPHGVKRTVGRWVDRLFPRFADHTVCVTDVIRDKLVGDVGLPPGKVSVISNGVEADHFDPARYTDAPASDGRTLIFTGNLAEYQGIDLMLEAFAQALGKLPSARLLIATDSPFDPYEEMARRLGIRERIEVIPSPSFDDLPVLLASSDVAVNPRVDCDGIPVKLLNYMAAAKPVVSFASSAPGVTHGREGWLAESGNVSALAEGMVQLLGNPEMARQLGAAARSYVVEHCCWSIVARRCEELYLDLIERQR